MDDMDHQQQACALRLPVSSQASGALPAEVSVRVEELVLPTYLPDAPDVHPMFLETRVYQGSNGKVYPLPFTDRITEAPVERAWKAVWIENEYVRVLVLPEIGGRVHAIQDKSNGYDLIYCQRVIKPALVGLAGPWVSGGIEFNWPQHHRPATFLPVDFEIENHSDGSKTVWCSDHDPMTRMKGMHGICLYPGSSVVEIKARADNRTPFVQTFLWWANIATRVHEGYQSFFPPDVRFVADHARRSISEYPLAQGVYYGVNYGERGRKGIPKNEIPSRFIPRHCAGGSHPSEVPDYAPNDLSFYANIPTPCSYMCLGSKEDFFGGYDHFAQAGMIHVADHHISPGKKQWTWGNHEFGHAWDRNLTEKDASGEYPPYIELMAGVYTDNQPDFSFLQPGETRTWSQFIYPIQKIGVAHHSNLEAAVSIARLDEQAGGVKMRIGISVTKNFKGAQVILFNHRKTLLVRDQDLSPGQPFVEEVQLPRGMKETDVTLRVANTDGREIISYEPKLRAKGAKPKPATEPPAPSDIASADDLYVTGLHLEQYRHATRCPTLYWREALRRDALDTRCNNAMGLWHLRRGEFDTAERYFCKAIQRLTRRNANPYDSEPYYNLGLCVRYQLDQEDAGTRATALQLFESAYAAFCKSAWNQAWQSAAFLAIAEMDCRHANWATALEHLNRSLGSNGNNTRARNLKVIVLRKLGRGDEAESLVRETLALDPLDWWARHLGGEPIHSNLQVSLDLAHDCARAGLYADAITLLERAVATRGDLPDQSWGASPMLYYTLGWLNEKCGDLKSAHASFKRAALDPPEYCFPARLEEIAVLEVAMRTNPSDSRAPYYLGNLLYDRRRYAEALQLWNHSTRIDSSFSVVWRNIGIGSFNVSRKPARARAAYEKALRADPDSARVLFERDQLWKRLGEKPEKRLRELQKNDRLVRQRDDMSVELCALYNQTGRYGDALKLVTSRKFQPWEGGEGGPLGQYVRSHLSLGREALWRDDVEEAREHFTAALKTPENLGEARHLLANQSDVYYWLGVALISLGDKAGARENWSAAATFRGDFQGMSVRAFSEMTYYSALSWERLGQKAKAKKLLRQLLAYARKLENAKAKIDYFATSLPTMLLFADDLQLRQKTNALFLQAQAHLGLGKLKRANSLLAAVLRRDPNHSQAADLKKELKR